MAIALISLFAAGLYMTDLTYYDSLYHILPWWHKSFGLLMLILLVFRVLWIFINPKPQPLSTHTPWEKKLAAISHQLLYLLILILGISGYLISTAKGKGVELFDWFEIPAITELTSAEIDLLGDVHFYLAWALIILAALHAMAALKHHFIDRDKTLTNITLRK
jgi:cytochrome b561